MKNILLCLILLSGNFSVSLLTAQDAVMDIILQGIALHDEGKYNEAIQLYVKALSIDKNSSLGHYEMGFTYMAMQEFDKAVKAFDKVIKIGNDSTTLLYAYINKASILDDTGKPEEAIKLYKKALRQFPENYSIYYNMGITQFRLQDAKSAEASFILAITLNPAHPSSHFALGNLQQALGNRSQSLLAQYFFLLLEPNTSRSTQILLDLTNQLNNGISKNEQADKKVKINVHPSLAQNTDTAFALAELNLSIWQAMNLINPDSTKTREQLFAEQTSYLFEVLGTLQENAPKTGFYWDYYVSFFGKLQKLGYTEAFCYHISQIKGITVEKWMIENKDKMDDFYNWLNDE